MTDDKAPDNNSYLTLFLNRKIGVREHAIKLSGEDALVCPCLGRVDGQEWHCANPPEYKLVELLEGDEEGPEDTISVGFLCRECLDKIPFGTGLINSEVASRKDETLPIALLVLPVQLSRKRALALRAQITERSIRPTRKGKTKVQ